MSGDGPAADLENPRLFTFEAPDYNETRLLRHLEPTLAGELELERMAANYSVTAVHQTRIGMIRVFQGVPRKPDGKHHGFLRTSSVTN